jgi:hypothetical protein
VQLAFYTGFPVASSFLLLVRREIQALAETTSADAGEAPDGAEGDDGPTPA